MCTYVLFTEVTAEDDGTMKYQFATQTDGTTTAKTPMGCFDEVLIPNDLALVIDAIDAYNED